MTHFRASTAVLLIGALSGCASYRPDPPVPPDVLQKQMVNDLSDSDLLKKYNALPQSNDLEKQAKVDRRNQILREYIWLIDHNYGRFEDSYYGSDANINFWSDTTNLALTGVSSVTGTAHLKSVLSALASGNTGIKSSYVKNFYDSQARAAVVQQMRALRSAQLAIIQDANHMKASVVAASDASGATIPPYSLEQGLADVDAYYSAGTIIGALQAIAQNAGKKQSDAETQQTQNSQAQQLY